jgi:phosphohistidine phosphatase
MSLPKIYIVRHAQPVDGEQMDPTREITPTGKKQAKMMGRWLKKQIPKHDLLLQSNMQRSQQTAKHIGKKLDLTPVTTSALDPDAKPEDALAEIQRLGEGKKSVVIVSHSPLVQHLVAHMTGMASSSPIHFPHAAVAHMEPIPPRKPVTEAQLKKRSKRLREAADEGATEKSWVGGTCKTCQENAEAGWIDMDDQFPSGDDEPPAHPNCGCELETRERNKEAYKKPLASVRENYPIRTVPPKQVATLHSLVTPNVVARDEDDLKLVTDDSKAVVEAALAYVDALESEHESQESSNGAAGHVAASA